MEGRPLTKENMEEPNLCRTQSRESGPSGLDRVREAARRDRKLRFTALLHHVTIDLLRDSYHSLKKRAAPGVDGVTWEEYGEDLEERLSRPARANPSWGVSSATVAKSLDPESRWKATTIGNRGAGRQNRPARGGDGSQPDLGRGLSGLFVRIPARAQPARCTGRALRRDHAQEGELGSGSWTSESFFDKSNIDWMVKFVEHRIGDKRIVRLIQKWLKAGVMEEVGGSRRRKGLRKGR